MRSGRDVLRQPRSRAPLLDALAGDVDRLVVLGDLLELRQGPVRDALAAARPVLSELAEALGPDGEVVIVPGNHDHHLLAGWLERRARKDVPPALGSEQAVDWRGGEPLAAVARALAPAERVRAAYPGVWLRGDVYAMHGHYADRHTTVPMFERLGAGAMARIVRQPDGGPRSAEDYEAIQAPIYAWLHALAQVGGPYLGASSHGASAQAWRTLAGGRDDGRRRWRRRAAVAAFPAVVAALNRAQIGPLRADLSGPELRRAALRAVGEVVRRLGIDAAQVIFGHTHRAGPLPSDEGAEWRAPGGAALVNTGCWVHEPSFLGERPAESPYRAGFAVRLADEGSPELVNLLDATPGPVRA
jgi:Calcineurin-like phosphoesterase